MTLDFLISISSETEHLYGVRFFTSFFKEDVGCNVTLFHISGLGQSGSSKVLLQAWENPADEAGAKLSPAARKALKQAREHLTGRKSGINQMKTKTVRERYGKVLDIITEGNRGGYDAIIMGRRGSYALQWLVGRPAEEIPQALINETALSCPLWICCAPETERKNILLCIDGLDNSLRAAEHVGAILKQATGHGVTVFHVMSSPVEECRALLEKAVEILADKGISAERIRKKSQWGLSPSSLILREMESGGYAAAAVGLRGASSSGLMTRLGMHGGTTATLIRKLSSGALWCVP